MSTGDQAWLTEFGAAVRAARMDSGLTQQDLAGMMGLHRSSVANIEGGRQDPSLSTAAHLIAVLGMTVPGWSVQGNIYREQLRHANADNVELRRTLEQIRCLCGAGPVSGLRS